MSKYLLFIALLLPLSSFSKENTDKEVKMKSLTLLTLLCPVCLVPAVINEGLKDTEKEVKKPDPVQRTLASEPSEND